MSSQRHHIRRQILEVKVQDQAAAWALQSALSRLQSGQVEALIDRCCTEAADPDRLHRIEFLEVDLGRLDATNLEQDLIEKLGPALRQALMKQIRDDDAAAARTGGDPETASRLELVALFARTGHLPWWAEASRPQLLTEAIGFLLQRAAPALVTLVRALARERDPLLRIVLHCDDERLTALAFALLAASRPGVLESPAELRALLRAPEAIPGATLAGFRVAVWMGVLRAAVVEGDGAAGQVGLWRDVLVRIALEAGVTYGSLVTGLHDLLGRGRSGSPGAPGEVVRSLVRELRGEVLVGDSAVPEVERTGADDPASARASEEARAHPGEEMAALEPLLLRLTRHGGALGELFAELGAAVRDAPGPRQAALLAALRELDPFTSRHGLFAPEAAASLLRVVGWILAQRYLRPDALGRLLEPMSREGNEPAASPRAPVERALLREVRRCLLEASASGAGAPTGEVPAGPGGPEEAPESRPSAKAPVRGPAERDGTSPLVSRSGWRGGFPGSLAGDLQGGLPADARALPRNAASPEGDALPEALADELAEPGPELRSFSPGASAFPVVEGSSLNLDARESDDAYVETAGLVVLWPFLGHLFERLELMTDRQFKDGAARIRAAGLLHHLATGELEPVEYQLPLAKVLCGVEATEVCDFGPVVTEAEAAECTSLLTAAIANAPILGEMTIAGFRGSFLIRKGVLGTRDGAWLLRVERASYDVVLDRFPWGVSWVKLPWMEAPLCVEW